MTTESPISAKAEEKAARALHVASGFPPSAWNGAPQGLLKAHVRGVAKALVGSGELVPTSSDVWAWRDAWEAEVMERRKLAAERDELRAERDRVQASLDVAQAINREAGAGMKRLDARLQTLLNAIDEHQGAIGADPELMYGTGDLALYAKGDAVRKGES